MSDLNEIITLVNDFKNFFVPSKISTIPDHLSVSNVMDLNFIFKHNEKFPRADCVGVYLIFSANRDLLYIGKASASSSIGIRLSTYFKNDKSKESCWKYPESHTWEIEPRYVAAIGLGSAEPNAEFAWLAPALEEFLISRFREDGKLENIQANT